MPINLTFQYFDDCPSWKLADEDLKEAVRLLGLDAAIDYERVGSHRDAERLTFRGSPTILISGRDPFADPDAPVGLSCRVYRSGGRSPGTPGVDALRNALRSAAEHHDGA